MSGRLARALLITVLTCVLLPMAVTRPAEANVKDFLKKAARVTATYGYEQGKQFVGEISWVFSKQGWTNKIAEGGFEAVANMNPASATAFIAYQGIGLFVRPIVRTYLREAKGLTKQEAERFEDDAWVDVSEMPAGIWADAKQAIRDVGALASWGWSWAKYGANQLAGSLAAKMDSKGAVCYLSTPAYGTNQVTGARLSWTERKRQERLAQQNQNQNHNNNHNNNSNSGNGNTDPGGPAEPEYNVVGVYVVTYLVDKYSGKRHTTLNARNEPGKYGTEVIETLNLGERLDFLGDQVERDGYVWYKVILPDGRVAWVVSEALKPAD